MKSLLCLVLLAGSPVVFSAINPDAVVCSDYNDYLVGYKAGFKVGYQKVHGQGVVAPIPPTPPYPSYAMTYENGFADGVLAGMNY